MKRRLRKIRGCSGYYVGDDGSVWSKRRMGWMAGSIWSRWRKLKTSMTRKTGGYVKVTLRPIPGGPQKNYLVHRLVLEAFVGPCPKGMECRHFPNRNTTDNRLCNLSWAPKTINEKDKDYHLTRCKGEEHPLSKLTEGRVRLIRARYATGKFKQSEIAKLEGLSQTTVSAIVRRKKWAHIT